MNLLRLVPPEGDAILVSQDRVLVGRDGVCDVHLRDASVSRHHAEIVREGDDWVVADLGSGNGVSIDGVRTTRATLAPGQELRLGNVRLRVEIDRGTDDATMIVGTSAGALAPTLISRTPARDPGPSLADAAGRRGAATPRPKPQAPPPAPRPRSRATMFAATLAIAGAALVAGWQLQSRPQEAHAPAAEASVPTPPATATPITVAVPPGPAAEPTPSASPEPAATTTAVVGPRRGLLLITANERVEFSIDGQRQPPLAAGEMRRVEVIPGEHLLSFDAGDGRRDQVVRAVANEQSVVRFISSTTVAAPPVVIPPTPAPVNGVPGRAPPATPSAPAAAPGPARVDPPVADEGLASGIAAARRGDFYRALLVLKDATRRLDDEPRAVSELALANAYLAWTYHALDRAGEAVVAAEKATRLDPSIADRLSDFPPPVRALFNRAR